MIKWLCLIGISCLLCQCSVKTPKTEPVLDIRLHDIWALKSVEGQRMFDTRHNPILELYVKEARFLAQLSCGSISGSMIGEKEHKIFFSHILRNDDCNEGEIGRTFSSLLYQVDSYQLKERLLQFYDKEQNLLMTFIKID